MLAALDPGEQRSRLPGPSYVAGRGEPHQLPGDQEAFQLEGSDRRPARLRGKAQTQLERRIGQGGRQSRCAPRFSRTAHGIDASELTRTAGWVTTSRSLSRRWKTV